MYRKEFFLKKISRNQKSMQNYPVDKEIIVCMLDDNFECALSSGFFLDFFFLKKTPSAIASECQTVWIQIRPGKMSDCSNCLQRLSATVNLEIFVRVLFSRNFAFHENDILVKWRNHSVIY